MSGASFSQVARTTLPRDERDRGLHALLGSLHRSPQGVGQARALADRVGEGVASRDEGVEHRLVVGLRLAAGLDPAHGGGQGFEPRLRVELRQPTRGDADRHGRQTPQRSPAVRTGASQSRMSSSLSFKSVIEQPAISNDVMYGPMRFRAISTPRPLRNFWSSLKTTYSSIRGVPPMPLTNA